MLNELHLLTKPRIVISAPTVAGYAFETRTLLIIVEHLRAIDPRIKLPVRPGRIMAHIPVPLDFWRSRRNRYLPSTVWSLRRAHPPSIGSSLRIVPGSILSGNTEASAACSLTSLIRTAQQSIAVQLPGLQAIRIRGVLSCPRLSGGYTARSIRIVHQDRDAAREYIVLIFSEVLDDLSGLA